MALTESEILRRHTFYQTSYIGPRPVRTVYTPSLTPRKTSNSSNRKMKQKNLVLAKPSLRNTKNATPCIDFDRATEPLDYRRSCRTNRARPWTETTPRLPKKTEKVQLHYERTLPKHFDVNNLKLKGRNYVSNSKYGNLYVSRQPTSSPRLQTPPTKTYVWEHDYLLWLKGTRDMYLEELTSRSKKVADTSETRDRYQCQPTNTTEKGGTFGESRDKFMENLASRYKKGGVTDDTSRSITSRPEYHKSSFYNSYRLEKSRRQASAALIQRIFRGWNLRNFIKKLKRKALLDHDKTLPKFVTAYKEIVARVQRRYGFTKTSCSLDLGQLNTFMDNKLKYEAAFKKLAADDKLSKADIMDFFNLSELWPTKGEVDRSFDIIFRGSRNTAEVIFLLDCSTCIDILGFHSVLQFIKDVVLGLDIGPDRVRVGVIPFNQDPFSAFAITAYTNKWDVLEAVSKIRIRFGMRRTDEALRGMLQMFKESRPGVQKIGILLTAGRSTYPDRTETLAQEAKESGVTMFAIGISTNADEHETQAIASSPKHIFTAVDPRSLSGIRTKLETRFCLAACSFCQQLLPRITRFGLLISEALDLLWTTYPPAAANIGVEKYLDLKILDENSLKSANSKVCLWRVIQSKLECHGYSVVPSDVREEIERVTSEDEALLIVHEFIDKSKSNI